jgi:hypothetical protein
MTPEPEHAEHVEHVDQVEHVEHVDHIENRLSVTASEDSLFAAEASEFRAANPEEDSATGYTETFSESNETQSEASLVLAPEEEISLLEKILTELAARHIAEEEHPADLADKEAQ